MGLARLEFEEAEEPEIRDAYQKILRLNAAEKAVMAMKGGREERVILIRDTNKVVALAVLRNGRITENEVESIAHRILGGFGYDEIRLPLLEPTELDLLLGGEVEMRVGREVEKIHDAREMLAKAHSLEQEAIGMYNRFALEAAQLADSGTKKLFEALVESEETHWDAFDQQANHIQKFGESYLALQGFQGDQAPSEGA